MIKRHYLMIHPSQPVIDAKRTRYANHANQTSVSIPVPSRSW